MSVCIHKSQLSLVREYSGGGDGEADDDVSDGGDQ